MAEGKDFREDMQRIGGLVQEIESIADPAVRAATKNLMQSLMGPARRSSGKDA